MVTKTKKLKVGEGAKKLDELLTTRKKKREETDPKILNWSLQPTEDDTGVEKWLIWTTKCGRYKIGRARMGEEHLGYISILRSLETQKDLEFLELDKKEIGNHPRKYKRLDSALDSVEQHLCKSLGVEEVISNAQDVLITADKAGLTKEPENVPVKRARSEPTASKTTKGGSPRPAPLIKLKGKRGGRPELFGHAAIPIVYWMGKDGWSYEQAKKVLEKCGGAPSDNSIKSILKMGAKGTHGGSKPADLATDQEDKLRKMR